MPGGHQLPDAPPPENPPPPPEKLLPLEDDPPPPEDQPPELVDHVPVFFAHRSWNAFPAVVREKKNLSMRNPTA